MDAERYLMERIYEQWGPLIHTMTRPTNDQAFIAALIANESGGDDRAQRFENGQYVEFDKAKCGAIPQHNGFTTESLKHLTDAAIRALATSYGLTQIMGYHVGLYRAPSVLLNPTRNLCTANKLITDFATHWKLDAKKDFEALFRCWNTGRPDGATIDPEYVAKGLNKMEIYRQIAADDVDRDEVTQSEEV